MEGQPSARNAAAWEPQKGNVLAVAGPDNDVTLYDRHSWKPVGALRGGHTQPVNALAYSSDGGTLFGHMATMEFVRACACGGKGRGMRMCA